MFIGDQLFACDRCCCRCAIASYGGFVDSFEHACLVAFDGAGTICCVCDDGTKVWVVELMGGIIAFAFSRFLFERMIRDTGVEFGKYCSRYGRVCRDIGPVIDDDGVVFVAVNTVFVGAFPFAYRLSFGMAPVMLVNGIVCDVPVTATLEMFVRGIGKSRMLTCGSPPFIGSDGIDKLKYQLA